MKKTKLWNSSLSTVVSQMGHTQTLTIGDGGLPVPAGVPRIDLAVTAGIPRFLDVLDAVLSELKVEKITLAEEIQRENPEMWQEILKRFPGVPVEYVPHETFKVKTRDSVAVVRTGENTAYSNIILQSGVAF